MTKKFDCVLMKQQIQAVLYKKIEKMPIKRAARFLDEIGISGRYSYLFKNGKKTKKKVA